MEPEQDPDAPAAAPDELYDLERKALGAPARQPPRELSPEEQAERLTGYAEVPREYWPDIRANSHIRYYDAAGAFHPGGFVVTNPYDYRPRGEADARRCLRLKSAIAKAPGRKFFMWVVPYDEVSRLYYRLEFGALLLSHSIRVSTDVMNANLKKIAQYVRRLDERVTALERAAGRAAPASPRDRPPASPRDRPPASPRDPPQASPRDRPLASPRDRRA
jgi:hypothetical protein